MITIYTDGSSRGNPGPGGWGIVIIYDNDSRKNAEQTRKDTEGESVVEIGGREEHTTNNRMELTAAIKALEFASKLEAKSLPALPAGRQAVRQGSKLEATLHTDSEYVMKGMTEWIEGWQKRGWKTSAKKPVLNQDLWQKLLKVSEGKEISWKYVAGHSGHDFNERCDEIATSFADDISVDLYNGPKSGYKISL